MKRRNFLTTVLAVAGALFLPKAAKASAPKWKPVVFEHNEWKMAGGLRGALSEELKKGSTILVYCRKRADAKVGTIASAMEYVPLVHGGDSSEPKPTRTLCCDGRIRNLPTNVHVCEVATRLVGDDFLHPVTGVSFPTENPKEFILRIQQNVAAKNTSYNANCNGSLPNIRADYYLLSKHFKEEMQSKGIDVLCVAEAMGNDLWVGDEMKQYRWMEPTNVVFEGRMPRTVMRNVNVFEHYTEHTHTCSDENKPGINLFSVDYPNQIPDRRADYTKTRVKV